MVKTQKKDPIQESRTQFLMGILSRIVVGMVLIYSGFSKAIGPAGEFAASIDAYRILPTSLVISTARFLPWIELYAGLFLICGYFQKTVAKFTTFLFGAFIFVLLLSLLRGIDPASCGCFGEGIALSLPQAIVLDGVLLALSYFLVKKASHRLTVDAWIRQGS